MKIRTQIVGLLLGLLLVPAGVRAQQQAQTSSDEVTHLRIDILLTEYNGDKKISSLPYTMYVVSGPKVNRAARGSVRMGVRVPVSTGSSGQFTYMDLGTDIDCAPKTVGDSYDLDMTVTRSSIYSASEGTADNDQIHVAAGGHPIVRQFTSDFRLELHDGQTIDGTSATDPLNGHVLKISVTLHVLK